MSRSSRADCPSLDTLLRYVGDSLPAGERAACEEHIGACSRCSSRLSDARELGDLEAQLRGLREDGMATETPNGVGSDTWIRTFLASLNSPGPADGSQLRFEDYDDAVEVQRGGQGIVYRAIQKSTGRKVAIKALKPGALLSPRTRARFEREVRILGQLDNEDGICPIIDCFTCDGETFLVMPFVEGETLKERLSRASELRGEAATGREAWAAIANDRANGGSREESPGRGTGTGSESHGSLHSVLVLMERIALAAQCFHERGIVHRDLTPRNVMVRPDGRPIVLDFGLARDGSGPETGRLTMDGELFGTPAYMAPEQADGHACEADPRTDVYSLGAILYELLTFRPPYEGPRTKVIFQRILRGAVTRPRKVNPAIPRDLEAVCLRAMEVDPKQRYATALELAQDLRRVRTLEPTRAKPQSVATRLLLRARRQPWAATWLGVALLAGLLAGWQRWGRMLAVDATVQAGQVLLEAVERGRIDEEGLGKLKEFGVEPDAYRLLDADYSKELLGQFGELGRALDDPDVRLLSPRSATTDLRPTFRFRVSPMAIPTERLVRLETEEGTVLAAQRVPSPLPEEGFVDVELSVSLQVGTRYLWSVCNAGGNPEAVAPFRALDPALVEARLAALQPSGDPALDVLLAAATLLALGLATPALELLDRFPDDAALALERQRRGLEARAFLLLGERDEARARLALAGVVLFPEGRPAR